MRVTRKLVWLAALAAALAALAAGCGGATLDPVAKAADKTAKVDTGRVLMTGEIQVANVPSAVPFGAQGAFDNVQKRGEMTMDLSKIAQLAGGQAGSPADWKIQAVYELKGGFVMYMRMPILEQLVHLPKPWLKIDLGKALKTQGIDLSQFTQIGQQFNATQQLDYLRATGGKVEKVGTEEVRGQSTTHYRTTIDLRKYPSLLPKSQQAQARASIDKLIAQVGTSTMPYDVWVGKDGLVHRIKVDLTMKAQGQAAHEALTVDYFDFGAPVSIQLPAADQTTDITQLAAQAQQQQQQQGTTSTKTSTGG